MPNISADIFAEGGCTRGCCHAVVFSVCWVFWAHMLGCSCIHFHLRLFGIVGLLDKRMLCWKIKTPFTLEQIQSGTDPFWIRSNFC